MTWPGAFFLAVVLAFAGAIWWIRSRRLVPQSSEETPASLAWVSSAGEAVRRAVAEVGGKG